MNRIPDRPAAPDTFGTRAGTIVDRVVLHTMEGGFEGTLNWFATPSTATAHHNTSAHWCIATDGRACRTVDERFAAYHCGNLLYNHRSIGIELEGFATTVNANKALPDEQMKALVELIIQLDDRFGLGLVHIIGLALDRTHIIGHNEVPNPEDPTKFGGLNEHTDPGTGFPWATLIAKLTQARLDSPPMPSTTTT